MSIQQHLALPNKEKLNGIYLNIVGQNKFGDRIYEQTDKQTDISFNELNPNEIWSIKNPINIPDNELGENRQYDNDLYFLSKKALSVIPKYGEGGGSICLLTFETDGKTFVIIVNDNKPYIMNCGGGKNDSESFEDCAIRELHEELDININKEQLMPYAEWSYTYTNSLIRNCYWIVKTICYTVKLNYKQVKHLILDENKLCPINIYDVKDYSFSLDELKYVIIIDKTKLEEFNGLEGKKFDGHHKKMLLDLFHIKNNLDISYLKSFNYY